MIKIVGLLTRNGLSQCTAATLQVHVPHTQTALITNHLPAVVLYIIVDRSKLIVAKIPFLLTSSVTSQAFLQGNERSVIFCVLYWDHQLSVFPPQQLKNLQNQWCVPIELLPASLRRYWALFICIPLMQMMVRTRN
jgi:hypothetical protein